MKKILSIISLAIGLSSCQGQTKFSKEALSQKLVTTENSEITFKEILENHKGKTTVIEIWASWCSDCVKAMPQVKEMQKNNPNIDYVFISMDKTFEKWQAGIEKHEVTGDNYWVKDEKGMKGAFGKAIKLDWIPRYIIINKKGKIVTYKAIETEFEKINTTLKTLE